MKHTLETLTAKYLAITSSRGLPARLTITRVFQERGESNADYICQCGANGTTKAKDIAHGNIVSCGCYRREASANRLSERLTTHGKSRIPGFPAWQAMIRRCDNPRDKDYKNYGGRGITVCDLWKNFENFLEDMGPRLSPNHSIDRIDNNKGYSKENCRWATRTQQHNNMRSNHILDVEGIRTTVAGWAIALGIDPKRIHNRLSSGWSVKETLMTPIGGPRYVSANL